jgi:hypothetical protein
VALLGFSLQQISQHFPLHVLSHFPGKRLSFVIRHGRILRFMYTIIETDIFKRYAEAIWDEIERDEFINWLAANPLDGDVVPGSGGMRKVRWTRSGMGKRGGTRVIYYNTLSEGSIWLLIAYTKAKFDDLPLAFLKQLKEEISDGR